MILRKLFFFFITLIIIVLLFGYVLLNTQAGLILVTDIVQAVIPGTLKIDNVQGKLLGNITIEHVNYEHNQKTVDMHQLKMNWLPRELINNEIHVSLLSAQMIQIINHEKSLPSTTCISNLQTTINGPFHQYTITAQADIEHTIAAKLFLQGVGNLSQIHLQQIILRMGNGTLTGIGTVAWHPDLSFSINPIQGQLNHTPLRGFITLTRKNQLWFINQSLGTSGNNTVHIQGQLPIDALTPSANLNWNIKLPQLNDFIVGATGSINSQGHMQGSLNQPEISGNLFVNDLHIKTILINFLQINGRFDLDHQTNLTITAHDLNLQSHIINQLNLNAQGNLKTHHLQLTLQNPEGAWQLESVGHAKTDADTPSWQGQIKTLTFRSAQFGTWQLNQPIHVSTDKKLQISPFCWASQKGALCARINILAKDNWAATVLLKHINLALLQGFMPAHYQISSDLNGQVQLVTKKDSHVQGSFNLNLAYAKLIYPMNKKANSLELVNSAITGTLDKKGLQSRIFIRDKNNQFPLTATINLPDYFGIGLPGKDNKITGTIFANWRSLSFLDLFFTHVQNINGYLNLNLLVDGKLAKPELSGKITVTQASMNLKEYGLNLTNITLQGILNHTNELNLSGQVESGGGVLHLTGTSKIAEKFPTTLNITGNNVLVYNTGGFKIFANPNLIMNYEAPKLSFTGDIVVPHALANPKDFSGTIELPENVVVIAPGQQVEAPSTLLYYQVKAILGDDITIKYGGLNAKMTGEVMLSKAPQQMITGIGSIHILKGYYAAYGQYLKINTGDLIFSGGSILNPNINVLATKTISQSQVGSLYADIQTNVVVGVRVIGTMETPKISFYANPAMPDAAILSYLAFGQGNAGAGSAVAQAASTSGIPGTGLITQLKNQLNLSELGMQSGQVYNPQNQEMEDNTSLVLGKQLSKRLSVNYSIGILVPVNIFRVIYQVTRHWSLQSDASAYDNGGDIVYTIQKN